MKKNILTLTIAMQEGMSARVEDNKIIIDIDTEKTKRDLWDAQLEFWLNNKNDIQNLSSGYMRVVENRLSYKKWRG